MWTPQLSMYVIFFDTVFKLFNISKSIFLPQYVQYMQTMNKENAQMIYESLSLSLFATRESLNFVWSCPALSTSDQKMTLSDTNRP